MKSLTEQLWFEVKGRRGFVNITELIQKSGVREGLCLVNAMHITAAVFINDNESGLLHDYEVWLEKLAPHAPTSQYQHNRTGEDNADAHLTTDHGPRSRGRDHQWPTRFWILRANLLR
jgi:secondary thiamine-phosphate synthase enzyme